MKRAETSLVVFLLLAPFSMLERSLAQQTTPPTTPHGCTFASGPTGATFSFTFTRGNAGIRDDGSGTYTHGIDGVQSTLQNAGARMYPFVPGTGKAVRTLAVDLNRPVDPAKQKKFGVVQRADNNFRVHWTTDNKAKIISSILDIPVGAKVASDRVEASVMIDERQHVLRFGDLDTGGCWQSIQVMGKGTAKASVHRVSEQEWHVDLPPGSIGELWDFGGAETPTTRMFSLRTKPGVIEDHAATPLGLYYADTNVIIRRTGS